MRCVCHGGFSFFAVHMVTNVTYLSFPSVRVAKITVMPLHASMHVVCDSTGQRRLTCPRSLSSSRFSETGQHSRCHASSSASSCSRGSERRHRPGPRPTLCAQGGRHPVSRPRSSQRPRRQRTLLIVAFSVTFGLVCVAVALGCARRVALALWVRARRRDEGVALGLGRGHLCNLAEG